jgi:hypothetical protein
VSKETCTPVPNGMPHGVSLGPIDYARAVDAEIERCAGPHEPGALWLEELVPVYAAGLPADLAATRILIGRGSLAPRVLHRRRRRELIREIFDWWHSRCDRSHQRIAGKA